jgi:hypothetical protein
MVIIEDKENVPNVAENNQFEKTLLERIEDCLHVDQYYQHMKFSHNQGLDWYQEEIEIASTQKSKNLTKEADQKRSIIDSIMETPQLLEFLEYLISDPGLLTEHLLKFHRVKLQNEMAVGEG